MARLYVPHERHIPRRRAHLRVVMGPLAAALATLFILGACTTQDSDADSAPFTVLTSFTVLADLAQNVAGEHAQVESITKVGAELHGYEPTPGDITKAAAADLVLYNGMGLEAWFEQFIAHAGAPHMVVTQGVEPIAIGGGPAPATADTANPHAWMSPVAVSTYLANIAQALAEHLPEYADEFHANAASYDGQIQALHTELLQQVATIPATQRVLATCEGAFSYLARDAGLEELYLWPVNSDQQVTPGQLTAMIEAVNQRQVPAVFCESTVSAAAMGQVVSATTAKFGGVLYVDSLSAPDGPVPTYLDLLRYNFELIAQGLGEGQ